MVISMVDSLKQFFSNRSGGFGLEVTPERVNLAQLSKTGQNYKLLKYCSVDLAEGIFEEGKIVDPASLAETIRELITTNKVKAKRVATALPLKESIIRILSVPSELDENELRELVLFQEASLYLPYPKEEVDLDYQKLDFFLDEDEIEKVNILLVGTKREITDSYVDTAKQANLQLEVLEVNSFALMRILKGQLQQFSDREAIVLVNIDFDNTEIVIVVNGSPQFSRTVPIGTVQMRTALAKAMGIPFSRNMDILQGVSIPATRFDSLSTQGTVTNPGMNALTRVVGELTDELRRSINFYLNQSEDLEVAQLYLAGTGAGINQLDEFFTQRLSLPTIQLDPIATLSLNIEEEISQFQRPSLGVVLGLAMRELS